jgi:hypothetical protein
MSKIALSDPDWLDSWVCLCGNEPMAYGFYPCNERGEEVEPSPQLWTTGCYMCAHCGRIIRQSDLEVVGRRDQAS